MRRIQELQQKNNIAKEHIKTKEEQGVLMVAKAPMTKEQQNHQKKLQNQIISIWSFSHNKGAIFTFWSDLINQTELILSGKKLKQLPLKLFELKNLVFLNICDNSLSFLPQSIGGLKHLRRLHLNHNRLTSLPETIGDLMKLQLLCLNNNQLNQLPKRLSRLKFLKNLSLDVNILPQQNFFQNGPFQSLKKLQFLHIRYDEEYYQTQSPIMARLIKQCQEREIWWHIKSREANIFD